MSEIAIPIKLIGYNSPETMEEFYTIFRSLQQLPTKVNYTIIENTEDTDNMILLTRTDHREMLINDLIINNIPLKIQNEFELSDDNIEEYNEE